MTELEIEKYAQSLIDKCGEAKVLPRAEIQGGNWQPEPNKCHHNVSIWCEHNEGFQPVRGWLYFDFSDLNYVKFVAHSAVRTPEGDIFDITPANASQEYPFIDGSLPEERYAELVESIENGELNVLAASA